MDIFQSEQARINDKIDEVVPLLEDVGSSREDHRGRSATLSRMQSSIPDSLGHKLIGSELHTDDVSGKFEKVRNELDVYAEKSRIVIKELTKMLTDIRYNSFILNSFKG